MTHTVKDFPIFHHYLASILLRVKLAEGSLPHILKTVGEYTVTGKCECGEKTCNTVYMSSDSLVGKDGAFARPFNIAWIIINFYKDGGLEVESLADREELNFPFREEIRTVLSGGKVYYDENYVEHVVEEFMEKLVEQEPLKIEV